MKNKKEKYKDAILHVGIAALTFSVTICLTELVAEETDGLMFVFTILVEPAGKAIKVESFNGVT